MALKDVALEKRILRELVKLERIVDSVGPSPVRYRLSELIVQMRKIIWDFDQDKYEAG